MNPLMLRDISDIRAYERERESFRNEIIALKKIRRISLGPVLTLVFENRSTIRFQIQEMARAEKLNSDQAIETELNIYNPLMPQVNELSATLFIELVSKSEMMEWLPKLVGIEESLFLIVENNGERFEVQSVTEQAHKQNLTRDTITASVHYIKFFLPPEVAQLLREPNVTKVTMESHHANYRFSTDLEKQTIASLVQDWSN